MTKTHASSKMTFFITPYFNPMVRKEYILSNPTHCLYTIPYEDALKMITMLLDSSLQLHIILKNLSCCIQNHMRNVILKHVGFTCQKH